jgi:hypothetical protein
MALASLKLTTPAQVVQTGGSIPATVKSANVTIPTTTKLTLNPASGYTPPTVVEVTVADVDHSAAAATTIVTYTSLSAGRIVTLPSAGLATGQTLTVQDATGLAAYHPIVILGRINGGTWAAVKSAYGSVLLKWNGTQWITSSRPAAAATPAITGVTYYVSASGNDSHAGTSPATAWLTIGKINTYCNSGSFHAGDAVLFEGGSTFSDAQLLLSTQIGTPGNPNVFGSYGTGQAKITTSVFFYVNWVVVDNLNIVCVGSSRSPVAGGSPGHSTRANDIIVQRCLLQGDQINNTSAGIYVWGANWTVQDNAIVTIGNSGIYCDDTPGSTNPSDNIGVARNVIMRIVDGSPAHNHGFYPRATNVAVLDNLFVDTSATSVCPRYRGSTIRRNHMAGSYEGIGFFQYDIVAGQSDWSENDIYGSNDASIYIATGDTSDRGTFVATQESFRIVANVLAPVAGAATNLSATSGSYDVHSNEYLSPSLPGQRNLLTDSATDPVLLPRQAGVVYVDANYTMRAIDAVAVVRAAATVTLPADAASGYRYVVKNLASLQNLYPNPSFEAGVSDMTANGSGANGTLTQTTAQAFSGTHSLSIAINTSPMRVYRGTAGNPFVGRDGAVIPGQSYTASAYVRAATVARHFHVTIEWYDSGGGFISQSAGSDVLDSTSAWTRVSVTGVAPATAAFFLLDVNCADVVSGGEVHYADALMFSVGAVLTAYGDGNTAGWSWVGTTNASASTGPDPTVTVQTPAGLIDPGSASPTNSRTPTRGTDYEFARAPDGVNWILV